MVHAHCEGRVKDGNLPGGSDWRGLLWRGLVADGAPYWTVVVKWRRVFDHPGTWCGAASQTGSVGGAVLIARRAEGCVAASGPHPGWRTFQLQDLKLLLWQVRHIVVLRGVRVPVGAWVKALGLRPPVRRGTVFWTEWGRRCSSTQRNVVDSSCSYFFQLGLGGLDPAGGNVFV